MSDFFTKACNGNFEFKAESSDTAEQGIVKGYASIFDEVDDGNDFVSKGAFRNSISGKLAQGVKMLFNHDRNLPVGRWTTVKEDSKGLYVEGVINKKTSCGSDLWENIKEKVIDSLSIGYKTIEASYEETKKGWIRNLKEVKLCEISFVTIPMLRSATLTESKDFTPDSIYHILRSSGINHNHSLQIATKGFEAVTNPQQDDLLRSLHGLRDLFASK